MEHGAELIAGRFRVEETVHRSARGSVLRARDRADGSAVALKIRARDAEHPDPEVGVLLRLGPHPGLPVVREELVLDDGRLVGIVMDWIDGADLETLRMRRPRHRFPPPEVAGIVSQAADTLDHLHRQDPVIVHGDVKPSNLMLTPGGRVVLMDFDVAGVGSFRTPAGSRGYLAPEAAAGGSVGPAIDVYGLAATAVALLTGTPPGSGVLELPESVSGSGPAAERALRRALAADPGRRTASAGRLAAELRASLGVE